MTGRDRFRSTKDRTGIPRADTSRPGQYLPVNSQTQPAAFRTPEQQAETNRRLQESLRPQAAAQDPRPQRTVQAAESGDEDEDVAVESSEESDNDLSGTYGERGVRGRPVARPANNDDEESAGESSDDEDGNSNNPPNDALGVNDRPWRVGQPRSQPLSYYVMAGANGETKLKQINFKIDFDDPDEVKEANKRRNQARRRAETRFGVPPRRASTVGREYTQANNDWLRRAHENYAFHNGGRRIPWPELTRLFNQQFPAENRTENSISSHVNRVPELRVKRNSYT